MVWIDRDQRKGAEKLEAGGLVAGGQVLAVPPLEQAGLQLHHLADIFI